MKKIIKNIIFATFAIAMIFSHSGCGDSDDIQSSDPVNIAFVVGIADDETKFNDGIAELATLPANPGTDYAFISVEGEPTIIGEAGTIPDLSDRGYTDTMMERVRAGIKADLIEHLDTYEPSSAEIDIASATELAVRTLNAHAVEERQNILVIYCGGKSTVGLINMLEIPVYQLDVEASALSVADKMNVDMSGIDVVWYCCGDFGDKQEELSVKEKAQLKAFYEQLFNALGAKSVTFKDELPSAECYHFAATPVSCMDVEGTVSGLKDLVELESEVFEDTDATALEVPIVIPESKVCYKPDSAEFKDPAAAAQAIQPIVDYMLQNPELDIIIFSTCAGDADCEYLSDARSERVKSVICAGGIDESRITVVNIKVADDPYYQFGLGTGSEASVNRKTVMMSTELAQEILSNAICTMEVDN